MRLQASLSGPSVAGSDGQQFVREVSVDDAEFVCGTAHGLEGAIGVHDGAAAGGDSDT